ncbi:MAG: hypothetical protein WCL32_23625 [Planctomycetota bacterium]
MSNSFQSPSIKGHWWTATAVFLLCCCLALAQSGTSETKTFATKNFRVVYPSNGEEVAERIGDRFQKALNKYKDIYRQELNGTTPAPFTKVVELVLLNETKEFELRAEAPADWPHKINFGKDATTIFVNLQIIPMVGKNLTFVEKAFSELILTAPMSYAPNRDPALLALDKKMTEMKVIYRGMDDSGWRTAVLPNFRVKYLADPTSSAYAMDQECTTIGKEFESVLFRNNFAAWPKGWDKVELRLYKDVVAFAKESGGLHQDLFVVSIEHRPIVQLNAHAFLMLKRQNSRVAFSAIEKLISIEGVDRKGIFPNGFKNIASDNRR